MGLFSGFGGDRQRVSPGREYNKTLQYIHGSLHGSEHEKQEKMAAIQMGLDQAMVSNPHHDIVGVDRHEADKLVADLKAKQHVLHLSDDEIHGIANDLKKEM
jgi:hypothetical protein